eukprot:766993-Hanusia_phi.AAC.1
MLCQLKTTLPLPSIILLGEWRPSTPRKQTGRGLRRAARTKKEQKRERETLRMQTQSCRRAFGQGGAGGGGGGGRGGGGGSGGGDRGMTWSRYGSMHLRGIENHAIAASEVMRRREQRKLPDSGTCRCLTRRQ